MLSPYVQITNVITYRNIKSDTTLENTSKESPVVLYPSLHTNYVIFLTPFPGISKLGSRDLVTNQP